MFIIETYVRHVKHFNQKNKAIPYQYGSVFFRTNASTIFFTVAISSELHIFNSSIISILALFPRIFPDLSETCCQIYNQEAGL